MVKMKVVDKFEAIKAMLNGEKVEGFTLEDATKFLDERITITEKKNAGGGGERKPTKTQLENEGIKENILAFLATQSAPVNMGAIGKAVGIESNQKVSALVTQLRKVGAVDRTEVKGKPYFALTKQE